MKGFNIGLYDKNNKLIKLDNIVEFLNMEGRICFEFGTFGISCYDWINYKAIQESMDSNLKCDGKEYSGVFNNNFISLYEIYHNFNCEDNIIDIIKILD